MAVIKILRSQVAGHVPSSLQDGQIAINENDWIFFFPDQNGVTQSFNFKTPAAQSTPASSDNSLLLATTAFVQAQVAALLGGAPSGLNTLGDLASAINDDANFSTTMTNALVTKLRFDASQTLNGTQLAQARANLGMTATGIALATAASTAAALLTLGAAALASPTFTGTPAAVTAAPGTNTTQLATTAYATAADATVLATAETYVSSYWASNIGAASVSHATSAGTASACSGNAATASLLGSGSAVCIIPSQPDNDLQYYAGEHYFFSTSGVLWEQLTGPSGWVSGSDATLKDNIKTLPVLATLRNSDYRAVSFVWNHLMGADEGHEDFGVIGDELLKIFPRAVSPMSGYRRDGGAVVATGTTQHGVSYSKLGSLALMAVKELADEVDDLRARLAKLEKA